MSQSSDGVHRSPALAVSRRGLIQGAGAVAGSLAFAGVLGGVFGPALAAAQDATPAASPIAINATGTLIEAGSSDISPIAPIVGASRPTLLIFDTLVSTNATTLAPQPNLAKSWTISTDGLTYTFTLADGVTFHDGQPFSSDDVKFTLDLLLNKDTASPYYSLFNTRITKVDAPDPATVVVTLAAPSPTLLGDFSAYSIAILPKHLLTDVKPADLAASEFATTKPVGTGPFKLKEYRTGEALILEANASYHRGAPKLAGYALSILSDATVAYQQLKTGEVDVSAIGPDFYQDATKQPNFTADVIDTFALNFVGFNQDPKSGPAALKELPVRQALYYAVDRQLLIDSVYDGLGKVAIGFEPPAATFAYLPDQVTETYAYSVDKAKSLLDAAGWVAGSDGIRAKNGEKLSFTTLAANSTTGTGVVQALQEFYTEIGVELKPDYETDNLYTKLLAKQFDLAFLNFTFAPDPDQSLAWASDSAFNAWSYNNPQVDALLKQGLEESDPAKRGAIYVQIENILLADLPAIVLTFDQRAAGVSKRITNYTPSAVGYYYAVAYDAPTWEIAG